MSVESMVQVFHHSASTGTTKLVLLGVANHDGDGGAFPAMNTLAVYAGIHVTGVRRHVAKLVALGELTVEQNKGGTLNAPEHMRPNLFHVHVPCPGNCEGAPKHRLLCDLCNEPLSNARRSLGTCTPGDCCPLSGKLGARSGGRCAGDERGNHAPGLCLWPASDE